MSTKKKGIISLAPMTSGQALVLDPFLSRRTYEANGRDLGADLEEPIKIIERERRRDLTEAEVEYLGKWWLQGWLILATKRQVERVSREDFELIHSHLAQVHADIDAMELECPELAEKARLSLNRLCSVLNRHRPARENERRPTTLLRDESALGMREWLRGEPFKLKKAIAERLVKLCAHQGGGTLPSSVFTEAKRLERRNKQAQNLSPMINMRWGLGWGRGK